MAGKRTKTTEPAHSPTHSHSDQDSDSDAPPETLTNTASRAHAKTVEAQVKAAEAGEKARRKERNRAREEQRWGGEAVVSVSGEKVRETAKAAHKKNGKEKAKDRNKESLKVVDDEDGASDDDDEEMEMDENDDAAHELVARMNRAMEDAAAEIDDDDDESEMDDDELADEDKVGDSEDEDGVENASDDDDDDDNGDDDDGSEDDEEDSDDDKLDADEGDELNAMEVDASEDSASDDDDDDDDADESQSHPPRSKSKHSSESKPIPKSQYLDPGLFAAAFASTATPPAAAMSKRLDATKPTQKARRKARSGTKAFKDVIIGTRTHRTLQHPHALPARVHPSRKVRAFLERSLKLLMRDGRKSTSTRADEGKGENESGKKTTSRSTQNRLRAKGERWERRPANIGTLKADGAPRGFVRGGR